MSIINQMLKDLEARLEKKTGAATKSERVFLKALSPWQQFGRLFLALFLLAGLLLVLDVYVISRHVMQKKTGVITKVTEPVVKTVTFPMNQQRAELTGMTVEVESHLTRLRFLLSQSILYRISSNSDATGYIITLDQTHPLTDLPLADNAATAIERLKMVPQSDGSLQIILQLKKGARLQQAGLTAGKSPEFQIDLVYTPPLPAPAITGPLMPPMMTQSIPLDHFSGQSLEAALKLAASGEIDKAGAILKNVISITPDFHPAREAWIRILMRHNRMDEAEVVLLSARNRYPEWLPYVDLQARWLAERGRSRAALLLMSRYSPAIQAHTGYYALMAALYQREHQPQMAATLYRQLIVLQPHNGKWWLGYAIALDASDKSAEAVSAYSRALQEDADLSPTLKAWIETRLHPM